LASHHSNLADQFAGRTDFRGCERFKGTDWRTLHTGAPILADAVSVFDCEIDETIEKHTHQIVIGRIRAALVTAGSCGPLIYWRRGYRELCPSRPAKCDVEELLMAADW
jgi:flavin reductase (DIM6/NTAB) family NADH-FMN oxidoreductase RutF